MSQREQAKTSKTRRTFFAGRAMRRVAKRVIRRVLRQRRIAILLQTHFDCNRRFLFRKRVSSPLKRRTSAILCVKRLEFFIDEGEKMLKTLSRRKRASRSGGLQICVVLTDAAARRLTTKQIRRRRRCCRRFVRERAARRRSCRRSRRRSASASS